MATKGTALVVEGFPGSGNSFVSNGLRKNIGADVEIESHFHYTAQLKRALAFGVPTIVIVREPQAAGTSLKSKQPELWNWLIVLRWILYHRYVLAHARELHVVLFSEAIRDLDVVRARCPALQTLAHGPLLADPELRRPSERKIPLAEGGRASRALRSVARDLYARIETITRTTDAGPDGPPPARDRRP